MQQRLQRAATQQLRRAAMQKLKQDAIAATKTGSDLQQLKQAAIATTATGRDCNDCNGPRLQRLKRAAMQRLPPCAPRPSKMPPAATTSIGLPLSLDTYY
jgi:hypothetical protein